MRLLLKAITKMREKGYQREAFELPELLAMYGEILVLEEERERRETMMFNSGLEAAARKSVEWADQSCGGSGFGGEGYRNLATSILSLRKLK
jgi:hypothetical protein